MMRSGAATSKWNGGLRWLAVVGLAVVSSGAFAFGSASKFVVIDNESSAFSVTGTWAFQFPPIPSAANATFFGEFYRYTTGTGGAANAFAFWNFGNIAPSPGSYQFDAFIPDDTAGLTATAALYRLDSAPWSLFGGCGAFTTHTNFSAVNLEAREGNWVNVGAVTLAPGTCYRLVLTNANNSGAQISANAARAERLFESSATITDMPRLATAFAPATTLIPSSSSAVPTIVTTLSVTCPQSGSVVVTASGESAAQTNVAGSNFNGLAYSISKNSTATDNSNVVQSSSLATFNGDANRDFLNVQRTDSCAANEAITYRLTAYRAQAATGPASFIWNGRLVAQYFAGSF